jgi:hypothetical protein
MDLFMKLLLSEMFECTFSVHNSLLKQLQLHCITIAKLKLKGFEKHLSHSNNKLFKTIRWSSHSCDICSTKKGQNLYQNMLPMSLRQTPKVQQYDYTVNKLHGIRETRSLHFYSPFPRGVALVAEMVHRNELMLESFSAICIY